MVATPLSIIAQAAQIGHLYRLNLCVDCGGINSTGIVQYCMGK